MSTKKQARSMEQRRVILLKELLDTRFMVRGTFGQVYRRCGKMTCWCVDGRGHLSNRISWTEQAKSRTKAVPSEDLVWIKNMTGNYRAFRKARQTIRELSVQLNGLLDQMERDILDKTNRKRKYL